MPKSQKTDDTIISGTPGRPKKFKTEQSFLQVVKGFKERDAEQVTELFGEIYGTDMWRRGVQHSVHEEESPWLFWFLYFRYQYQWATQCYNIQTKCIRDTAHILWTTKDRRSRRTEWDVAPWLSVRSLCYGSSDRSIELFLVPASGPRTTSATKAVVCAILSVGCAYKRTLAATRKEQPMWRQRVSSLTIWVILYHMFDAI